MGPPLEAGRYKEPRTPRPDVHRTPALCSHLSQHSYFLQTDTLCGQQLDMTWQSLALLLLLWTATTAGQATTGSNSTTPTTTGNSTAPTTTGSNSTAPTTTVSSATPTTTGSSAAPTTTGSSTAPTTTASRPSNSGPHTDISFSAVVGSSLLVMLSLWLM